jgi:hypothetical protein
LIEVIGGGKIRVGGEGLASWPRAEVSRELSARTAIMVDRETTDINADPQSSQAE